MDHSDATGLSYRRNRYYDPASGAPRAGFSGGAGVQAMVGVGASRTIAFPSLRSFLSSEDCLTMMNRAAAKAFVPSENPSDSS
jgi:uncharacterized protein RhaS with RHS repeats